MKFRCIQGHITERETRVYVLCRAPVKEPREVCRRHAIPVIDPIGPLPHTHKRGHFRDIQHQHADAEDGHEHR